MKRAMLLVGVVLAAGALAGVALAQESRRGSKTGIVAGMHTEPSGPAATAGVPSPQGVRRRLDRIDDKGQLRAGIQYFGSKKGKKALCAMYQDTDFGKEVLDGIQIQADKLKIKIVETTTHKPTDQDFTAQITRLKAAGCDLVVLGTIVRDSIVPYATARKIGWTDVDFLGSAASYDLFVAAAQGGVTEGLYAMGLTDMPYRDTLSPTAQAWFDRYKERYKNDPNIGAIYGHVAADLTALGLEKAGADLTLNALVKGLESIRGYKDIFNGPEVNFAPDKHQGANSSFLAIVKGGRWVRLTDPLTY